MVFFFFYKNFTSEHLIKKINTKFDIEDAYILSDNYDNETEILTVNNRENNIIIYGKLVNFDMKLENIIKKIIEIEECRIKGKINYTLDTIWTTKKSGGMCKAYIIF
jgi:hypothetical protein